MFIAGIDGGGSGYALGHNALWGAAQMAFEL